MSVNNFSPSYLQSIVASALQGTSSAANASTSVDAASSTVSTDAGQLSPFAQMLSMLQQLQQSDPAKYQQVTAQIATNLDKACQTAAADGNTTAAARLEQLSKDFGDASKSGQLPNVQDLAQAVHGHHHGHGHHHHAAASDNSPSSAPDGDSNSNPLLAAFLSNSAHGASLDPLSIITSALPQV